MKVSVEAVRRQYADLSDEALLDVDRQDLVDLARKCYDEELARRGLKAGAPGRAAATRHEPEPEEEPAEPLAPGPPDDDDEELVVAETYDSPEAARLARELLRTSGIRAVLGAEGLEVQVPASTQETAQAVLISELTDEALARAASRPGYIRPHRPPVQPYLCGTAGLIEFVQRVFGAREVESLDLGPNLVRVDVAMGGSVVILEVADTPIASAVPASVYVYVLDVDAAYILALDNGAEEIAPPEDKPYGERVAAFRDAFGNTWRIATYQA
jgi:PhnB protein